MTTALEKEFQDAQDLAKAWHPDATLYTHTVSFPASLARSQSKRVYVFSSVTTQSDWWTVTVNEQTGQRVRAQIPKEDYLVPTLPAVPLEYWKVNSLQALQIADAGGGKAFREKNPGTEITANLTRQGPNGWLWWVVNYRGLGSETLSIRIQPASGEIYNEDGKPVTTPTPAETSAQ